MDRASSAGGVEKRETMTISTYQDDQGLQVLFSLQRLSDGPGIGLWSWLTIPIEIVREEYLGKSKRTD